MLKQLIVMGCFIPSLSFAYCFDEAATRYGVDPLMLKAIAKVESGMTANVVSKPNSNGSVDIGLMQINEIHLPMLAKFGITKETLLSDPCVNVNIGAWILSKGIKTYGKTWKAVGSYNSGNPEYQSLYVQKVSTAYFGKATSAPRQQITTSNYSANRAIRIIEGTDN